MGVHGTQLDPHERIVYFIVKQFKNDHSETIIKSKATFITKNIA